MSVVAFRYKNFMAFRDTGWIELRPIGLLFGRNSSGKSAIIRGLRLLKQSLRTDDGSSLGDPNALRFAVESQLDLGDFRSALHQHSESAYDEEEIEAQKITFAFRIETSDLATRLWQRIQQAGVMPEVSIDRVPSVVELNLEFGYSNNMNAVRLIGVHLDCPSSQEIDSQRVVFVSSVRPGELIELSHPDSAGRYTTMWSNRWYWASDCYIGDQLDSDSVAPDIDWAEVEIVRRFGFLPHLHHKKILKITEDLAEATTDYALTEIALRSLSEEIRSFLQNIEYLGPIRPQPERVYQINRFALQHWRDQGLGAWGEFITTTSDSHQSNQEETRFSSGYSAQSNEYKGEVQQLLDTTIREELQEEPTKSLKSFQNQMDGWIEKLQLGSKIQVQSSGIAKGLGYASQVFIVKENGKSDTLVDVGYGASQVLPVIATCLWHQQEDHIERSIPITTDLKLIIIEQPELHLHPRAQAQLGDLFIQSARLDVRLLLETHSEHLLLRLQKQIAKTTAGVIPEEDQARMLLPNQFAVYFVNRKNMLSSITRISIGAYGDLLDTPEGFEDFFSDDMIETAERMRIRLAGVRKAN
jgi:predicted ATPase